MKRSDRRILTSHVGSLPRPDALIDINRAKFAGETYDAGAYAARLSAAVEEVCRRQADIGIDVVNDGEFGKTTSGPIDYGAWSSYAWGRLSGWERGEPGALPALAGRRDRLKFAEFYRELDATSFRSSSSLGGRPPVFTGPIGYVGHEALRTDLANFKAALAKVKAEEGFITSVAPGSFARRQNRYYASDEAFLHALGEAMREEYKAIVEAGFVLQLDDPGLPDSWDMANPEPKVDEYKKFATVRIEALNHALRGLPEDRIRYHICWGSFNTPHVTDVPLKDIVDLVLRVKAGGYCIEMGNPRHEHEWRVWENVKLPPGRKLIPGVISHSTNVVEHPELVAERLTRLARLVGRENVLGGTDCGFAQSPYVRRVHPSIMWAKLEALAEGARLASRELWGRKAA